MDTAHQHMVVGRQRDHAQHSALADQPVPLLVKHAGQPLLVPLWLPTNRQARRRRGTVATTCDGTPSISTNGCAAPRARRWSARRLQGVRYGLSLHACDIVCAAAASRWAPAALAHATEGRSHRRGRRRHQCGARIHDHLTLRAMFRLDGRLCPRPRRPGAPRRQRQPLDRRRIRQLTGRQIDVSARFAT